MTKKVTKQQKNHKSKHEKQGNQNTHPQKEVGAATNKQNDRMQLVEKNRKSSSTGIRSHTQRQVRHTSPSQQNTDKSITSKSTPSKNSIASCKFIVIYLS